MNTYGTVWKFSSVGNGPLLWLKVLNFHLPEIKMRKREKKVEFNNKNKWNVNILFAFITMSLLRGRSFNAKARAIGMNMRHKATTTQKTTRILQKYHKLNIMFNCGMNGRAESYCLLSALMSMTTMVNMLKPLSVSHTQRGGTKSGSTYMHYKHAFSRRYLSNVCLTHFSKWKKVHEIAERAHLLLCIVFSFRLFSNAKYRCLEFVWTVQQWTRSRIHLPMQWMERYTALHLPLIRVLLEK